MAYKIESEQTAMREFLVLLGVKDRYLKFVVTMDDFWKGLVEGVKHFYISNFLVDSGYCKKKVG